MRQIIKFSFKKKRKERERIRRVYLEIESREGMHEQRGGRSAWNANMQSQKPFTSPSNTWETRKLSNMRAGLASISLYDPLAENKNSLSTSFSFPSSNRYTCKLLINSEKRTKRRNENHKSPEKKKNWKIVASNREEIRH